MITWFLSSYIGMYITQAVLHSLIANTIVEFSFFAWKIHDHRSMFRYRLLTLTLPIVLFPVFQAMNPARGSLFFRYEKALFNSHQWFSLNLFGIIPLHTIFFLSLVFISLIFLFQEILPILKSRSAELPLIPHEPDAYLAEMLDTACSRLGVKKPPVMVIDEDYPILFAGGTMNHTLVISRFLLEKLSKPELISALLHELIHMKRGSSVKTQLIYIARMLMFFNLFSLIEFRRLVHDDEFICDSMTVSITNDPHSLARALEVFITPVDDQAGAGIAGMRSRLEVHSHNAIIRERIQNVNRQGTALPGFNWLLFVVTGFTIIQISYMVV